MSKFSAKMQDISAGLGFNPISAAAAVVGTGIESLFARSQSRYNYELADKAADRQYERQLDFWNRQNAYNSPSQVLSRWRDAGINPLAVVSGGNAGSAGIGQGLSNVPGNDYGKRGALPMPTVSPMKIFTDMTAARKMTADAGVSDLTAARIPLQMEIDKAYKNKLISETEYRQYMTLLERLFGIQERQAGIDETNSRTSYNDALTKTEDALRDLRVGNLDVQNQLVAAQTASEGARKLLIEAQTESEKERARNIAADTILKGAQTIKTRADARMSELLADVQSQYNDFMLHKDYVEVDGVKHYKGSHYENMLVEQLNKLVNEGKISRITANNIGEIIELDKDIKYADQWLIEANTEKVRRDDSTLQRGLNFVSGVAGVSASYGSSHSTSRSFNQSEVYTYRSGR